MLQCDWMKLLSVTFKAGQALFFWQRKAFSCLSSQSKNNTATPHHHPSGRKGGAGGWFDAGMSPVIRKGRQKLKKRMKCAFYHVS